MPPSALVRCAFSHVHEHAYCVRCCFCIRDMQSNRSGALCMLHPDVLALIVHATPDACRASKLFEKAGTLLKKDIGRAGNALGFGKRSDS